jgi:hypothetical protein
MKQILYSRVYTSSSIQRPYVDLPPDLDVSVSVNQANLDSKTPTEFKFPLLLNECAVKEYFGKYFSARMPASEDPDLNQLKEMQGSLPLVRIDGPYGAPAQVTYIESIQG